MAQHPTGAGDARPYVPESPRFRFSWLRPRAPPYPTWLADEEWTPPGERGLYTHARTGLAAALEARTDGGTALVPAYVAPSVVRVCLSAGLDVEYYPVSPSLSVAGLADRVRAADPAVVVCVHYFGFADPVFPAVAEAAADAGALLVEDAARGLFGRDRDGTLLGARGDVATFSLRKVLPIPTGGLVVAPGLRLPRPPTAANESVYLARSCWVALRERFDVPDGLLDPANEAFQTARRVAGDGPDDGSPRDERPHVDTVGRRPGHLSRLGLARCRPAAVVALRRARYAALRSALADVGGLALLTPTLHPGAAPYGVALRLAGGGDETRRLHDDLREAGLPAAVLPWPLDDHLPQPDDPGAATLRRELLVIPTHQQLPARAVDRIAATVERTLSG